MKYRYFLVPALVAAAAGASSGCSAGSGGDDASGGGSGMGAADGTGGGLNPIDPGGGLNPGEGGGENQIGLPTSVILTPECESDCVGFSDPENPDAPWVAISGNVTPEQMAALDGGGPDGLCVSEPASGTIFPAAWTRPRFNATGASGPMKVVLTTARMRHPLTIYSETSPALLPFDAWVALSKSVYNEDVTYEVTSGGQTGKGTFKVAPVAAGGSMVFWGSEGTQAGEMTNALYGFGVGAEGVIRAITPGQIQGTAISDNGNLRSKDATTPGHSTCVGCHSSTPDGAAVASMDDWSWNVRLYSVEGATVGAPPEYLTGAGAALLSMTWLGGPTFSSGDWNLADAPRRMVTTWSTRTLSANDAWKSHDGSVYSNTPTELVWMDLKSDAAVPVDISRTTPTDYANMDQAIQKAVAGMKGTAWEVMARNGDSNSPVLPDWSHDGKTIVYTSTDVPQDGRVGGATVVDLVTVPFNGGAGGDATKVSGADSDDFEYYPDFSPDDALIAFNKLPKFTTNPSREDSFDHVYYRPDSDIHVVPSAGGTATRLTSNDAVCEGTAGQLYNSWAKWSPSFARDEATGRTYYFLIFSTARNAPFQINRGQSRTSPASQLYMTTIIVEADGSVTSGPAIYLWNQRNLVQGEGEAAAITPLGTNNVTPAWDEFKIPPVPPVVVK